jgi:hypothetical protein
MNNQPKLAMTNQPTKIIKINHKYSFSRDTHNRNRGDRFKFQNHMGSTKNHQPKSTPWLVIENHLLLRRIRA